MSLTSGLNPSRKLRLQRRRVLSRVVATGAAGSRSFLYSEDDELMASVKGCVKRFGAMIMVAHQGKSAREGRGLAGTRRNSRQKHLWTVRHHGIELSVSGLTGCPHSVCRD